MLERTKKPSENPDAAKKQDDISDVKVTITEAPKVEIVKTPPVQVDITPAPPSPRTGIKRRTNDNR